MRPIVQFAVGIVRIVADKSHFQPALKKRQAQKRCLPRALLHLDKGHFPKSHLKLVKK